MISLRAATSTSVRLRAALTATQLAQAGAIVLFLLTLVFFAVRVQHGIYFISFVDEATHLLGGKMLNQGAILYRTFVDAHGPTSFMLTQAYGALFGWGFANGARFITVCLALVATAGIATTPALPAGPARLWAGTLFLGLTAVFWLVQGLYLVNYHAIAGFLLAASLGLCFVPAWRGTSVSAGRAALAGACAALVAATAYSFALPIALFAASALWAMERQARIAFMAGTLAGSIAVLIWMIEFADFTGFVVFHFIANQFYYAPYTPFTFGNFLHSLAPDLQPATLVQTMASLFAIAAFLIFGILEFTAHGRRGQLAGPILIGFLAMMAQNARGGPYFQNGSFLIASIATLSMAIPAAVILPADIKKPVNIAVGTMFAGCLVAAIELAGRHALISPVQMTRAQMASVPQVNIGVSTDPERIRIGALVNPNERILAVPFEPDVYLSADRAPMDGFYEYLPWDADYARKPWFGHGHDLCEAMRKTPPKLVYFNHWIVWDRYDMGNYIPCFITILDTYYVRQKDFPNLYLRADDKHALRRSD